MGTERNPDLSLFLDILHTLEAIEAPYVIIGAFAAAVYGSTRTSYDIDLIVDLSEEHIQALAEHYPVPRFYADPHQMRDSIRLGVIFNIIDTDRGEKADLVPVTMHPWCREVLANRVRQLVEAPGQEPFDAWIARGEDVAIGKLMAWKEGRSRKHEIDIFEMLTFHYLGLGPSTVFDEGRVDAAASSLGEDVVEFWTALKEAARREARRSGDHDPLPGL